MNKFNLFIVASVFIGATTSCNLFKSSSTPTYEPEVETDIKSTPSMSQADAENMIDGEWTVYSVNNKKVAGESRPYITFNSADHRIYGSNGCNVINGDYTLKNGSSIQISNVISTMMACPDAPYEQAINKAINDTRSFIIQKSGHESYLDLRDNAGKTLMVLRRHNMNFLNGSWKIVKIDDKAVKNPDVEMVIDIQEQRVHGNTGCNILNGSLLIDPDKSNSIQFQNLATTKMMCPDTATETSFLVALESVEFAKKGKHDTILMYDKDNNPILVLEKIKPENE